ncbi:hypothetical protein F53441_7556 [Fusarium austroafricanum]|uniref:Uncharacterized protein n=1 Tax=Fusarium austroafricanum TaxID=2364996 RepID=A0A8H4NVE5_9HYPO|nr:hypothetical protein F53441_7556 [Fusarium austroafricanum]
MNPCAPTFIPIEPPEDGFSSGEDESTPSSMEARLSDQDVRSPRARPRGRTIPTIAIDPEGYESMFPALRTANQVDPLKIRSPKMRKNQRDKSRRFRVKGEQIRHSNPVSDKRLSIGHKYSQSSDDEEEEEHSGEPPLEYLKPTVYTPRRSLEFLKPTVYTPPTSSHNACGRPEARRDLRSTDTGAKARARTRSPRRAWRPPTPHPDGKPRGVRPRRTPTPSFQGVPPVGYPGPVVYPPPSYSHYVPAPPRQIMHYPIDYAPPMGPPVVSYSPVPWPIPSTPWLVPLPQPEVMINCPPDFDGLHEHMDWPSFEGDRLSLIQLTNGVAQEAPLRMTSVPVGKDRQLLSVVCDDDSTQEEIKQELRKAAERSKTTGFIPTRQVQGSQDSPCVVRGARVNSKEGVILQEQQKSQEKSQELVDPLQKAPKGPSSLRQFPQMFSSTVKQTLNLAGSESGSWSQSRRWTSFATKERQAFQKMMANLRYMSADQSPFVPQSPVELTAFKASLAESKTRKLDEEVKQHLAKTNANVYEGIVNKTEPMMRFLSGKKFEDRLSPVFAASNCFNRSRIKPPYAAEWPSLAELKEEGDKRSSRQGRCLPLPRLGIVASRFSKEISEACNSNGTIRSEKKAVQVASRYICPVASEEPSITPAVELKPHETPVVLATLLQEIDVVDDEVKKEKEEKD